MLLSRDRGIAFLTFVEAAMVKEPARRIEHIVELDQPLYELLQSPVDEARDFSMCIVAICPHTSSFLAHPLGNKHIYRACYDEYCTSYRCPLS